MQQSFSDKVYKIVELIPHGRVMTYGQIAGLCGNPRAARIVGGIAHFGPTELPWHRVVNIRGELAKGYHGGRKAQAKDLIEEGVEVEDEFKVDINKYIWWPE